MNNLVAVSQFQRPANVHFDNIDGFVSNVNCIMHSGMFSLFFSSFTSSHCLNIWSFMTRTFFSCDISVVSDAVMGFGIINHNVLLGCHLHDWWGVGMQCSSLSGVKCGISEPFVFHDVSSHIGQLVCIKLYSFLRIAMVLNWKPCKLHKQAWLSIKYSHSDWIIKLMVKKRDFVRWPV